MLELRPYQHEMANFIIKNPRCNLFVGMGLGKTAATLTAIDALIKSGQQVGPVLIVAPLRVANLVWKQEAKLWPHLKHLRVSVITGNVKQRLSYLKIKADIYITNYENLVWLTNNHVWNFTMVVADESSKLKGFRTRQGGKAAMAIAKHAHVEVKRWVNLTGTPIANGVKDLWGPQWYLDAGKALGRNYTAFQTRWFRPDYSGFNYTPLPYAQEEIQAAIAPLTLSLRAEDHFDLDKPIVNIIEVELEKAARALYASMEKKFYADITSDVTVDALNAASKSQKLLQLANGAIYLDDGTFKVTHDAKLAALEEIVESVDEPILVVYHFKSDLARLQAKFAHAKVLESNPNVVDSWNKGEIPMLLVNAASAGHGLSLQHGGRTIVFFAVSWNMEHHEQVIERLGPTRQMQSGYTRSVFVHYILAKHTIDGVVMDRLANKSTVQQALMKAMSNGQHRNDEAERTRNP